MLVTAEITQGFVDVGIEMYELVKAEPQPVDFRTHEVIRQLVASALSNNRA